MFRWQTQCERNLLKVTSLHHFNFCNFLTLSSFIQAVHLVVAQASCLWNRKSHSLEGCATRWTKRMNWLRCDEANLTRSVRKVSSRSALPSSRTDQSRRCAKYLRREKSFARLASSPSIETWARATFLIFAMPLAAFKFIFTRKKLARI